MTHEELLGCTCVSLEKKLDQAHTMINLLRHEVEIKDQLLTEQRGFIGQAREFFLGLAANGYQLSPTVNQWLERTKGY